MSELKSSREIKEEKNGKENLKESSEIITPGLQKSKIPLKKTKSIKPLLHGVDHGYWNKFKFPQLFQQFAGVTHIDFSPTSPHHLAIATSTRIQVYNGTTTELEKSFTKFKDVAYGPKWRIDGKLLASGGEQPLAKIFDFDTKTLLREFKGHLKAVHSVAFGGDKVHLASGSDDNTIRYWDISTGQDVVTFRDHTDYVRTLASDTHVSEKESNYNIIASGSYDHTIKLWDIRDKNQVLSVNHGSPVEQILMFPKGTLLFSAGGNVIKVWDVLAGGKLIHTLSSHQKTVTSICLTKDCTRLLSGSIDQMVKVYDLSDYSVVSNLPYPSPVLSLGVSPDNTKLAVGMADGMLSLKTKVTEETKQKEAEKSRRGTRKSNSGVVETIVARQRRQKKLAPYDSSLNSYKFKEALDLALESNDAIIIISMISELARRGALKRALSGRDDKSLLPILHFINTNFGYGKSTSELLDLAHLIIALYSGVIGQSPQFDEELKTLKKEVEKQIRAQRAILELMGTLDLVIAGKQ